jgi:subtilisin family serine protease
MIGVSAAGRSRRRARNLLIGLQIALMVFSMAAPLGTIAAEPSEPPAAPTDSPTPSSDPTPSADPTVAPDPTGTPDPSADPSPTSAPSNDPTTPPSTPEPTPDSSPAAPVSSFIVTFVAGTSGVEQSDALALAGATDLDAIAVLRMHAIHATNASADTLRADPRVASVEADRSRTVEADPDDPSYADQWSLTRIGWDQAHDSIAPSGSAVVAVLDTGVDASHPDLAANLVAGASFVAGSAWNFDPNGHGTAMAGIVAAETGNGIGIAGVGYAGVRVMPVTVLGADGLGRDSDIIEGLVWAVDHDADVALMAFSASGYSSALQAAVDYAWSHGVVVVAATGNDGSSSPAFPAGDRGVVGVSSTDSSDALSSSSNFGADTFLGAPGHGIVTTATGGGVASVSGTSASAAAVAAAAALLRASDASLSAGAVVGRLARNADPAGTVDQTGNGRLNLYRALTDSTTDEVTPAGAAPIGDGGQPLRSAELGDQLRPDDVHGCGDQPAEPIEGRRRHRRGHAQRRDHQRDPR